MRKYLADTKVVIDIAGHGYGEFSGWANKPNVDLDAHNYQVLSQL